jgi:AmmeMemoRadiSam system protein A
VTPPRAATGRETAFTAEERRALLRVARAALEAHFTGRRPASEEAALPALREKRGAFVTLHEFGSDDLRGCVGLLRAERALAETVAEMAVAAATADRRFAPVTAEEVRRLRIAVSALGPLHPIRPEEVEVGRDGLLVSYGGRRGVLLPQVPVEHGWDRESFLDHTCVKAGLPPGTWRKPGVELLAFTAEVVEEDAGDEGIEVPS